MKTKTVVLISQIGTFLLSAGLTIGFWGLIFFILIKLAQFLITLV